MTDFGIREPVVPDTKQQRNNEDLLNAINQIGQFLYWGNGAPTFTPSSSHRALYIRLDGGAATTLYVWQGAAWAGK